MKVLRFRKWFEANDIASLWSRTSVDSKFINEEAVNEFTDRMSNDRMSSMMYGIAIRNRSLTNRLYDEPISANLIYTESEKLGNARGVVTTNIQKSFFGFHMKGSDAGNMDIIFPPVIFEDDDRALLRNIIRHECVHANDWAVGNIDDDYPLGEIKFDVEKYATNLYEVRALVTQFKGLLKEIKDKQKLLKAVINHPAFGVNPDLAPIVTQYLMNEVNEGIGKLIMPVATAAALMQPGAIPEPPKQPTPIVQRYDQQEEIKINRAANLIANTVKLLKFGKFIAR